MSTLTEAEAAYHARRTYRAAAERHAQRALVEMAVDRPRARFLARLANLLERVASLEVER